MRRVRYEMQPEIIFVALQALTITPSPQASEALGIHVSLKKPQASQTPFKGPENGIYRE